MTEPDPARLAAIDQQLAAFADRLDRNARTIMRGDGVAVIVALAVIAVELIVWPAPNRLEFLLALAAIATCAAGGFIQGLMLRSYRAEIRDLRARK